MDAPKYYEDAIARFKNRPYCWACGECYQPLSRWSVNDRGFHMCGSYPVWGDAPKGVRRCPACGGRKHWRRWVQRTYGVTSKQAGYPVLAER